MPEIHEYYCSKCGTRVRYEDMHCPNCKLLLAIDGAVRIKKIKVSEEKSKLLENIYEADSKLLSKLTKIDKERFKKHNIKNVFPVLLCLLLHILTLGIFTLIYFGMKHGKLPKIEDDDPSTGQAIGYCFIPFFNIYWRFIYWLKLTDRINFQYKLRGKEAPIDRTFVMIILILGLFLPFYLELIIIFGIQNASNKLVNQK